MNEQISRMIQADMVADFSEGQAIDCLRELLGHYLECDPDELGRGSTDILAGFDEIAAGLRILAAHPVPAWQPGPPRSPGWYWLHYADGAMYCFQVRGGEVETTFRGELSLITHHIGPLAAPAPPEEGGG